MLAKRASLGLSPDLCDRQGQRIVRGLRAMRADAIADHVADRLESCASEPCGSAACPMCCNLIDANVVGWSAAVIENELDPWLVVWCFVPPDQDRGNAGLASLHPATIRAALDRQLTAAGLDGAQWLGRMCLQGLLAEPGPDEVSYSARLIRITSGVDGVDVEASLRDEAVQVPGLHLMSARRVDKASQDFRESTQVDLTAHLSPDPEETFRFVLQSRVRSLSRRENNARLDQARGAELAMARHWGLADYGDLLLRDARELTDGLAEKVSAADRGSQPD